MNLKKITFPDDNAAVSDPSVSVDTDSGTYFWVGSSVSCLKDFLDSLGVDNSFAFSDWLSLPSSLREEIVLAKEQLKFLSDAVLLTEVSTDEEQLEAYEALLGHLQPIYYPVFDGDLEDLVHDFWVWMNSPVPYSENIKNERNVPNSVKVWAIRWLQNLNRNYHYAADLDARMQEELARSRYIDLEEYLDEAYSRIWSFSEKQLVSFIRKFKELLKFEKGEDYSLSSEQAEMFTPLFETAQFLLKEMRTADAVTTSQGLVPDIKPLVVQGSGHDVELTEPLLDLLYTLFPKDEASFVPDSTLNSNSLLISSYNDVIQKRSDCINDDFFFGFYTRELSGLLFKLKQINYK